MQTSIFSRVVMALALGAALAACAVDGEVPPNLTNRSVRLTLLHTADWHSRLFPYNQTVSATDADLGLQQSRAPFGGAARMNWLIQRERAHADRLLHLDSGDCFQGAPIFNFFSGEAEVRSLDATGVDGVVVGNHEFDRGAANFALQYSRWATFPVLAANYLFDNPTNPGSPALSRLVQPYHMYNLDGLKVAVIGFGNLSSITSLFDQPNRTGITALNTREVAQFYIDFVKGQGADVVVGVTHLGLTDDQRMIADTTGFDVVLGGHLHIVLNPTQEVPDCQATDAQGRHFVPELDMDHPSDGCGSTDPCCTPEGVCAPDVTRGINYWQLAPGFRPRYCSPRTVLLQHSGAFMKYLGRLDLVLSNDPTQLAEMRGVTDAGTYQADDRFEVIAHTYTLFPVDSTVPEEPVVARLLEPYGLALDRIANLDNLIGYAPSTISRTNDNGGDSPMGNLVTTAMWRRLGVQTDFSLTNTLGIRDAIPQGPVSLDQIYNVFPFDNSITTMLLSGREVLEMFDFIARRSSGRGCNSQAQIAGARVVISCGNCDRDGIPGDDLATDGSGPLTACAETVNIGLRPYRDFCSANNPCPTGFVCSDPISNGICLKPCTSNADCNTDPNIAPQDRSLCEPTAQRCMQPISGDAINGSYALAANDYIAAGGSGFFVLQRNTTQVNTRVQLRDAVTDHVQLGSPCGFNQSVADAYRTAHPNDAEQGDDGLVECSTDADCTSSTTGPVAGYECSCPERYQFDSMMSTCSSAACTSASGGPSGRCVLTACGDALGQNAAAQCPPNEPHGDPNGRERCLCAAASRGTESCRILSCFDQGVGAFADGRIHMVAR